MKDDKLIGQINVIGVNYSIYGWKDFKEMNEYLKSCDKKLDCFNTAEERTVGAWGYSNYDAQEIHIYMGEHASNECVYDTILHELCHVYLFETGYSHYGDEDFIFKLTKWIPRIIKITNVGKDLIDNARDSKE